MTNMLRRNLLVLMLGVTSLALTAAGAVPSLAKDGSDSESSGRSDSRGSGSGGGDNNSGSSHGDDNSGHGGHDSDDDDDDDNSRSDDDDDSGGDNSSDDSNRNKSVSDARVDKTSRPTVIISLTPESLAGVQNGSLAVVDNLGRVLEIELDRVRGAQVIKAKPHGGDAKRNPGPITSFKIVPIGQAPVHG